MKLDPTAASLAQVWCSGPGTLTLHAGIVAGSRRHFPAHLQGKGVGGEEAAAGSRQELRLGVGQGLLCWELSSGSHQRGGREGAAFPGPHTPAGPAGTQPASPQPPSPTWGSPAPLAQAWHWAVCLSPVGLQQGHCLAATSPKALDAGLQKSAHLLR